MKKKSLSWFKQRIGKSINRLVMPIWIANEKQAKALYDMQKEGVEYKEAE